MKDFAAKFQKIALRTTVLTAIFGIIVLLVQPMLPAKFTVLAAIGIVIGAIITMISFSAYVIYAIRAQLDDRKNGPS